jgi:sec-independent protein translocase protein TatA
MPNIGPFELVIVLVVVLLIFGPKQLPTLGRSLGTGMREFKDSITGNNPPDEPDQPALSPVQAPSDREQSRAVNSVN